jgi:hypothetical protein
MVKPSSCRDNFPMAKRRGEIAFGNSLSESNRPLEIILIFLPSLSRFAIISPACEGHRG